MILQNVHACAWTTAFSLTVVLCMYRFELFEVATMGQKSLLILLVIYAVYADAAGSGAESKLRFS